MAENDVNECWSRRNIALSNYVYNFQVFLKVLYKVKREEYKTTTPHPERNQKYINLPW